MWGRARGGGARRGRSILTSACVWRVCSPLWRFLRFFLGDGRAQHHGHVHVRRRPALAAGSRAAARQSRHEGDLLHHQLDGGPAGRHVRQRSQHAQGERHGDRRAHRLPPRPPESHERRGEARALPQPQLADGSRLRRLRHGVSVRLDQRLGEAARGRMRLQRSAQRRSAPVRRKPRVLRDGAAARHVLDPHAQRARDDDDARRHAGDGHQRREQRRRMGPARDP